MNDDDVKRAGLMAQLDQQLTWAQGHLDQLLVEWQGKAREEPDSLALYVELYQHFDCQQLPYEYVSLVAKMALLRLATEVKT